MDWLNPVGGLLSSIVGGYASYKAQQSANAANMRLAQAQNQWNIEQWNRNNEYNLPSAQVQRLKDAGLNVGLMYANGADVGNSTAPAQGASVPEMKPTFGSQDVSPIVNSFFQVFNAGLASRHQSNEDLRTLGEIRRLNLDNDFLDKTLKDRVKSIVMNNEQMDEATKLIKEQVASEKIKQQLMNGQVDMVTQQVNNLKIEANNLVEQCNLTKAQQDEIYAAIDKVREEINWIGYNAVSQRISANASSSSAKTQADALALETEKWSVEKVPLQERNRVLKDFRKHIDNITKNIDNIFSAILSKVPDGVPKKVLTNLKDNLMIFISATGSYIYGLNTGSISLPLPKIGK